METVRPNRHLGFDSPGRHGDLRLYRFYFSITAQIVLRMLLPGGNPIRMALGIGETPFREKL